MGIEKKVKMNIMKMKIRLHLKIYPNIHLIILIILLKSKIDNLSLNKHASVSKNTDRVIFRIKLKL